MSQVKKAYEEVIALLEANANKKVSTIMPELLALVTAKGGTKSFHKDAEGNVVAIYCYYHKQWELVTETEYGKKASTSTGLNTMCKEGVSSWSKQQRDAKKAKDILLAGIADETIVASSLTEKLEEIEIARKAITKGELGFETLDEALAFNN